MGSPIPYLAATLTVAVVALLAKLLQTFVSLSDVSIVFLVTVLVSAVRWGLRSSIFAAILSVLTFDFFFVSPVHTFLVASPQDLLALAIFLVVAILTSNLTATLRAQAEAADARERQTAALYTLSRKLASVGGLENVLQAVVSQVAQIVAAPVIVLLPAASEVQTPVSRTAPVSVFLPANGSTVANPVMTTEGGVPDSQADLRLRASSDLDQVLSTADVEGALEIWRASRVAPVGAGPSASAAAGAWLYAPLSTAQSTLGLLGVRVGGEVNALADDRRRLVEALAGQAAVALERASLAQDMAKPGYWPKPNGCASAAVVHLARPSHSPGFDHRRSDEPVAVPHGL